VLARLHLNTFKVDAVLPMDWSNPYAAAAATVQPDSSSGSALYLLASLFNHSCEPCVNINFPNSDGTAVFTAARRISAGEQLFVSYTDTEQEVDVRQHYLSFAYGFSCSCTRCREEIAELQRMAPPQL
jgi:SET and MYND domain-containing protein